MPFVHPARKRRRPEDDDDHVAPVYGLYNPKQQGDSFFYDQHSDRPRKVLPLPSKRARINHDDLYIHKTDNDNHIPKHRRRPSRDQTQSPSLTVKPRPNALLTPCHVCSTHPTRKNHLDSFAYCQGCGEWTCYICIRECQGWNVDVGSVVSQQEALSRSFQMQDADADDDGYEVDSSTQARTTEEVEGGKRQDNTEWSWKARGHQSIICRRCCVEQNELGGEVACWACHLALDGAVG
ncbi:hypothetical protein ACO1O0_001032 [Amphichorda felina]